MATVAVYLCLIGFLHKHAIGSFILSFSIHVLFILSSFCSQWKIELFHIHFVLFLNDLSFLSHIELSLLQLISDSGVFLFHFLSLKVCVFQLFFQIHFIPFPLNDLLILTSYMLDFISFNLMKSFLVVLKRQLLLLIVASINGGRRRKMMLKDLLVSLDF